MTKNEIRAKVWHTGLSVLAMLLIAGFCASVVYMCVLRVNSCVSEREAAKLRLVAELPELESPRTKNNLDLVKWAIMAEEEDWGYVYGTFGYVLSDDLLEKKSEQYPDFVGENEEFIRENYMDKHVTDCVGLIKGYCWYDIRNGFEYQSNGMPDIGANAVLENAEEKGDISTIPEIPGLAVCRPGHIGVYIGDGWVIEALNTKKGVIKTRLEKRDFTSWCKIPYIVYI